VRYVYEHLVAEDGVITEKRPQSQHLSTCFCVSDAFPSTMDGFSVLSLKLIVFSLVVVVMPRFAPKPRRKEKKSAYYLLALYSLIFYE
jgi:hypothetical protein